MHELILIEIIAVPAERSRGRHNPRVVKRKMSRFATKARAAPAPSRVFRYADHVRVVAPADAPADQAPPSIVSPDQRPEKHPPRKAAAPTGCLSWVEQVRTWRASGLARAAYCERHGLNPRTFNHWVARSQQTFRKAGARS
jgi:hypothetical protein